MASVFLAAFLIAASLPLSVSAEMMGTSGQVISVSAQARGTLIENDDGFIDYDYNPVTEEYDLEYFCYYLYNLDILFTVEFENGDEFTGCWDEIEELTGEWLWIETDQSYENQWGVGTHTATVWLGELSAEFEIEVIESPVESLFVTVNGPLFENSDGYLDSDCDPDTNEWFDYFYYDLDYLDFEFTVNFKDGTSITGTDYTLYEETGRWVYFETDQSYENAWGVGIHPATARFMGAAADFEVEVAQNPVDSISAVANTPFIENIDGYIQSDYNPDTDEWDLEYFYYELDYHDISITVNYKDGASITGTDYEIYDETGRWVYFETDQSYENAWGVGTHTATARFMGVAEDFEVEVAQNPVDSISAVANIPLIENIDGYFVRDYNPDTDEYDLEFFYYELDFFDISITVNYKDGTSITGTDEEIFYETGRWVFFETDQSYENQWDIGMHTATAEFLGVTADFEIEVAQNPYSEISISGDNELIITLTKADAGTIEHKAVSFEPYEGDDGVLRGCLLTDKGKLNNVTFTFDAGENNYDYQNVTLKYGALESNMMPSCKWLRMNMLSGETGFYYAGYTEGLAEALNRNFNGFDGNITEENIDDIICLAFHATYDIWYADEDYEDDNGYYYCLFEADAVRETVSKLFDTTGVDFTKSQEYDAETGNIRVYYIQAGGEYRLVECTYDGECWIAICKYYSFDIGANKTLIIVWDENMKIVEINVKNPPCAEIDSDIYSTDEDGLLFGVTEETTLENFLSNIRNTGLVTVTSLNGVLLERNDFVGTGSVVRLFAEDGSLLAEYTVVVKGDVNGDGKVGVPDARKVLRVAVNLEGFGGNKALGRAARVTEEGGKIGVPDARKILRVAVGLEGF